MNQDTQLELIAIAKKALTCLSTGQRDENVLYALRDTIRKAESEVKNERTGLQESQDL